MNKDTGIHSFLIDVPQAEIDDRPARMRSSVVSAEPAVGRTGHVRW
ncbi:hypothetical protein [Streptosporangium sp. 'caverna']|nr:hypothetical protein [Streptosporangium sp. 'caverna']